MEAKKAAAVAARKDIRVAALGEAMVTCSSRNLANGADRPLRIPQVVQNVLEYQQRDWQ
jgi:hypothetical protein